MRKLNLITLIILWSFACENTGSMQTQNASNSRPAATMVPEANRYVRSQEYHYNEAIKLRSAGKPVEAINEFKTAIELGNDDKETYREVSRLLISLDRHEEAEQYLQKVLEKDYDDALAHWALAKILVEHLGRYKEGLREAVIADELYGDDDLSYVRSRVIGKAYDGLRDHNNALKHYQLFLHGNSYAPETAEYKEIQNRVSELKRSLDN